MVKKKREFQFSSATFLFAAAALVFSSVYAIQLGNRSQAAGSANISATTLAKNSSSVITIPVDQLESVLTIDRSDSRWAGRAIKGVLAEGALDYWVTFGPSSTDTNSLIVRFSGIDASAQATQSVDLGDGGKMVFFNDALFVLKNKQGQKSIELFDYRTLEHWSEDSIALGTLGADVDLITPSSWNDGPATLAYSNTTKKTVMFDDMYQKIEGSGFDMSAITDPKSITVRGNRIFRADSL